MSHTILFLLFSSVLVSLTRGITTDIEDNLPELRKAIEILNRNLQKIEDNKNDIARDNDLYKYGRSKLMREMNTKLNKSMSKNLTAAYKSHCLYVINLELDNILPEEFTDTDLDKSFEDMLSNINDFYKAIEKRLKGIKKEFDPFLTDSSLTLARYHEENKCSLEYKVMMEREILQAEFNLMNRNLDDIRKIQKKQMIALKWGLRDVDTILLYIKRLLYTIKCAERVIVHKK